MHTTFNNIRRWHTIQENCIQFYIRYVRIRKRERQNRKIPLTGTGATTN